MKGHIYKFNKIVVGGNFCAMVYAYFMGYPIVYKNLNPPHKFDTIGDEESKLDKYRDFCLLLSLSGLVPCGHKAESIRIHENTLRISTGPASVTVIEFDSLLVFEPEQIDNIEPPDTHVDKTYEVIDWFNVRSGMRHDHDYLQTDSEFVRHVYFYPSDRIDGNHDKKDLASFSYISEENLKLFDYSPTIVKFKVLKTMKEAGIRGTRNGKNPLYPTSSMEPYKYRAVDIEPDRREVKIVSNSIYKDTEKLKFMNLVSEKEILELQGQCENKYLAKLGGKLIDGNGK
jgi:hypothetical protein|tara:strand:- start:652 stop:1509 length:858 start_codon:yes stop_codon:yes gene_type:complete